MEELKQFIELHRRRLLKGAIFLAPLLCAFTVASMTMSDLGSYQHQPTIAPVDPAMLAQARHQNSLDPSARSILPIFGQFESEEEKAAQAAQSDIPATSLNLTLHAIFYSTDPEHGSALISKQGHQKARIYKVGSPIMKGVRLEQVQINNVVINRNGNSESLQLPRLGKKNT